MILGVRELGMSLREPAMRLEISAPAVGESVERGEDTACPFHSLGKSILSALAFHSFRRVNVYSDF